MVFAFDDPHATDHVLHETSRYGNYLGMARAKKRDEEIRLADEVERNKSTTKRWCRVMNRYIAVHGHPPPQAVKDGQVDDVFS